MCSSESLLVITGKMGSGKTTMAKEIASKFPSQNVVWIKYSSPFTFSGCTEKTKLLIVEDIMEVRDVQFFVKFFVNLKKIGDFLGNRVTTRGVPYPKILLICQSGIGIQDFPKLSSIVVECGF